MVRDGAFVHVAMGTLVDDPTIRPTKHIFVGSKAPWFTITDDLPQYERAMVVAEALRQAVAADAPAIRDLTRAAYAKWVPLIGREPEAHDGGLRRCRPQTPLSISASCRGQAGRSHRDDRCRPITC